MLGKEGASTPFHDVKADIFKAKDVHIIVKAHSNDFSNTFKELEVCREGALKYGVEKVRSIFRKQILIYSFLSYL